MENLTTKSSIEVESLELQIIKKAEQEIMNNAITIAEFKFKAFCQETQEKINWQKYFPSHRTEILNNIRKQHNLEFI